MILLILGAVALGTAVLGVGAGATGVGNMNEAKEIGERAQKRYEDAVNQLKADWKSTNKAAQIYGEIQIDVRISTIKRFVSFLERIGQRASQSDLQFLDELEISTQQIKEYKATVIEAEEWLNGGVSAAVTGAAAASGAANMAKLVGTTMVKTTVTRFFGLWTTEVVTEVGISQLTGAAARSATLAWLGGGSVAAGGFVLGGITLGPALMVGGFQLAGKGEEALTKAREYEAKVNTELAKIEAAKDSLQQVERRIAELRDLVESLNKRAVLGLNELESLESQSGFDKDRDVSKLQQVALLVTALVEIMKIPVLNNEGNLNPATATIKAKYRTLGAE